jgi:phospholipid transport system substrate-binding protein
MKKILITLSLLLFSFNSFAQNSSPKEMVNKFVQILGDQIIQVANDKTLNEAKRKQKIINIIDKSIDSKWIARFVLGRHYKTANEEQRKTFMNIYREFMINTYGPKFNSYNGKKFAVNSVEKQGSFYLAKSEFTPKNSDVVIFFDFRVIEDNGEYFIVDFIAEGVSLIETQRSEFNSSINEEGLDKFLITLKKRVDELKSDNNKSPKSKTNKTKN